MLKITKYYPRQSAIEEGDWILLDSTIGNRCGYDTPIYMSGMVEAILDFNVGFYPQDRINFLAVLLTKGKSNQNYFEVEDRDNTLAFKLEQSTIDFNDSSPCWHLMVYDEEHNLSEFTGLLEDMTLDREIIVGRITAMRVCDYRNEYKNYGSSDSLIEQIQSTIPLNHMPAFTLANCYKIEVGIETQYPWEDSDLVVEQREFLGVLNNCNPEDPWLAEFNHIWD